MGECEMRRTAEDLVLQHAHRGSRVRAHKHGLIVSTDHDQEKSSGSPREWHSTELQLNRSAETPVKESWRLTSTSLNSRDAPYHTANSHWP